MHLPRPAGQPSLCSRAAPRTPLRPRARDQKDRDAPWCPVRYRWVRVEGLGRCASEGVRLTWSLPRPAGGKVTAGPVVAAVDVSDLKPGPLPAAASVEPGAALTQDVTLQKQSATAAGWRPYEGSAVSGPIPDSRDRCVVHVVVAAVGMGSGRRARRDAASPLGIDEDDIDWTPNVPVSPLVEPGLFANACLVRLYGQTVQERCLARSAVSRPPIWVIGGLRRYRAVPAGDFRRAAMPSAMRRSHLCRHQRNHWVHLIEATARAR
jgi:hypothetical protein